VAIEERLALIRVKIERAKKHLNDLESEVRAFLDSNPYGVGTKPDTQYPNTTIYYLASIRETPSVILSITGDVLFNLRAALDHLAYQLALVNGTTHEKILRGTSFPISEDAARYKADKGGKVKGMSQMAIDAIDATKPYKGGNDMLWRLHRLNNIDKHRVVVTTVAGLHGVAFDSRPRRQMIQAIYGQAGITISDAEAKLRSQELFIKPEIGSPLNVGNVLAWDQFKREPDEQMQIRFEIALNEPQVIYCQPLLKTLLDMFNGVESLVMSFKTYL